jgi:hypothetical protein
MAYLESALKTESTYVCFKYFHELFFSVENSPQVTLRVSSKSEFHQTVVWTVQINFKAYTMLLEPKMASD